MSQIKAVGELRSLIRTAGQQIISIAIYGDVANDYAALKSDYVDIAVKRHCKKRSLSANALCWALCSEIGNALQPPLPKEDVYRRAIRDVGVYEQLIIREEAVETFQLHWKNRGVGWFAEITDDSLLRGYKEVFAYCGTSTYDSREMNRLIDYLIDEARQMDLQIAFELDEIERIKEDWARECHL